MEFDISVSKSMFLLCPTFLTIGHLIRIIRLIMLGNHLLGIKSNAGCKELCPAETLAILLRIL